MIYWVNLIFSWSQKCYLDHSNERKIVFSTNDTWTVSLNAGTVTIKLRRKHWSRSVNLCLRNGFLDKATKAKVKGNSCKLDSTKIKPFVLQWTPWREWEINPQNGTKYLQITYLRSDCLQNIKNSYNSTNTKKINN